MELPNYSQLLLQQLYALYREQQFCDCSVLVGTAHFRAHKLILAAASLLFRSALDGADTVSIDASLVAPDDFAVLLEMIYTGKLPLGKHHFSKVISVADSLQMFDVAVSCKTLLRELLSCSSQDQGPLRDSSLQTVNASSENTAPSNQPQAAECNDEDVACSELLSPGPAATTRDSARVQEQSLCSAVAHGEEQGEEMMHLASQSQNSEVLTSGPSPGEQSVGEEGESTEPSSREKDLITGTGQGKTAAALIQQSREELIQNMTTLEPIHALLGTAEEGFLSETEKQVILACCESSSPREAVENLIKTVVKEETLKAESLMRLLGALEAPFPGLRPLLDQWQAAAGEADGRGRWDLEAYGKSLLRCHQAALAKYVADPRLWKKALSAVQHLVPGSRETMERIAMDATEPGGFDALASAALEKHTLSATAVWQLVLALQEMELSLKPFLAEIRAEPEANLFFQSVGSRDGIATEIILGHGALISAVLQQEAMLEAFPPGEAELVRTVKELLNLSLPEEASTASWRAALSSALDKSLPASQLCNLLCSLQGSCPDLQPVMRELQQAGLVMKGGGEKAEAWQWKVMGSSQGEMADNREQKARHSPGLTRDAASKKSLACQACRKSFHFFCRLKVHEKRCRMANQRQVQCQECNETRAPQRELEKQQGEEAHGRPGSATATQRQKKKQRRLPVACDICGRKFAHASGMQYHKLTEHFDEKPFSCEECGAKFAANSTLRNHQRLHSGDRPFICKHCLAAFSQASALAYHAKRKHAEGKMYACQYCTAVFAQSIELSRHVRTHTGDKPYVCRECGKGFRQANGLSIHLRTFHNIEDPYDCKKCQMSFPTLQEHQQHIHLAHSREYHPCPTCGKVFSAPSLLERHMVTHVGRKPFSCEICNKAYQQLSGLWYHNRTHHPDIFAAQNHRSSKFSSLQCSSCDKTFSSTAAYRKHTKEDHGGSPPFRCPHCSDSFHLQGALQNHVASEHTLQAQRSLGCGLCGELFSEQEQLEKHCGTEHPKVVFADASIPAAHIVQVIQAPEQVITLAESELAGSQVFLTLPDSQGHLGGRAELVTVTMEDLLNEKVTLICQEAK